MNKKRDKYDEYDEAALRITGLITQGKWHDKWIEKFNKNIADELRTAFPPIEVSEDARMVAGQILLTNIGSDEAAALIEAYADKRKREAKEGD